MRAPSPDRTMKIIAFTITTLLLAISPLFLFGLPGLSAPISEWTELEETPYPVDTASSAVISQNGYIYVIGGKQFEPAEGIYTASDKVYYSAIAEDGSLEGWQETSSLPDYRYLHAVAANDEFIYSIGGAGRDDGENNRLGTVTIFRAAFLEDGSLDEWRSIDNYPLSPPPQDFNDGINLHEAIIIGDHLYVLGGFLGGYDPSENDLTLDLVQYARIDANGGLGSWNRAPNLPEPLRRFSVATNGNRIYVMGGTNRGVVSPEVYFDRIWYADVQANGRLSAWRQASVRLPSATYYHEAVIHDGRLVVLGGINSSGSVLSRVVSYAIEEDGSLGAATQEPSLPATRMRHSAVAVTQYDTDHIYVIGGYPTTDDGDEDRPTDTVYRSSPPAPPPPPPAGPGVVLTMRNQPVRWIAPGQEVTYIIDYVNPGDQPVQDVEISDIVPEEVELIAESVSGAGAATPLVNETLDIVSWSIGELGPGESGQVSYRARRLLPVEAPEGVLSIRKSAPAAADPGDTITYSIVVTNNLSGFPVQNLVISDTVPIFASGVIGPDDVIDGVAEWRIAELAGGASVSVEMSVLSNRTLVNYDYRASAENGRYEAFGQDVIVTNIGDTDPGPGDFVVIANNAQAEWVFEDQEQRTFSNWVRNPNSMTSFDLYMPVIQR